MISQPTSSHPFNGCTMTELGSKSMTSYINLQSSIKVIPIWIVLFISLNQFLKVLFETTEALEI